MFKFLPIMLLNINIAQKVTYPAHYADIAA